MTAIRHTRRRSRKQGAPTARRSALTGLLGEEITARYLTDHGWQVLDRRWRPGPGSGLRGELDLVALDPVGPEPTAAPVLVAVEVKTRSGLVAGSPAEAVTCAKLARLRRLVSRWAERHRPPGTGAGLRVDVVSVLLRAGAPAQLRHHRGVTL